MTVNNIVYYTVKLTILIVKFKLLWLSKGI